MSQQTTDSPQTLQQLNDEYELQIEEAAESQNHEAVRKKAQDERKRAIDVIGKNLKEFEAAEKDLKAKYEHLKVAIEIERSSIKGQLTTTGKLDAVKKAIDDFETQGTTSQQTLLSEEPKLYGESEVAATRAKRQADCKQKLFMTLTVKELKDRITQVETLFKDADKLGPADAAAAYALLHLATKKLTWSEVLSDFESVRQPFAFPTNIEDYEQKLVKAITEAVLAVEEAVEAEQLHSDKKSGFAAGKKELAEHRRTQRDALVEAATTAATSTRYSGGQPAQRSAAN